MELIDPPSVERLSGLAFFLPSDAVSGAAIHLGGIEMMKLDYGLKVLDIPTARRGIVYPKKRVIYGRSAEWQIQGNQFSTPQIALQLAGTRLADAVQPATTGATYTFTAVPGGAYYLGASSILLQNVKVGTSDPKVQDYDFFLDDFNGWIWLPVNGGTIVAGDVVVVTFDYPGLAFEQYTGLDTLSSDGVLTVFAEDHFGPPAREKWVMNVTLSFDGIADMDPMAMRSHTLKALVYGEPQVFKRAQPYAFGEIALDSGSILDLSTP